MENLKNKKLLISALSLGLVILTVFFINRTPVEVLNSNISFSDLSVNASTFGSASASYMYFKNYDQADEMADTVVIGEVIKVNEPEELVTGETINTITGEKEPISHIYTVSEVKVSKVIKGKYSPDDIIKIKQYGGAYKDGEYSMEGIQYYQEGERHIFFLQSYEDSPCDTINPQQGDMLLKDGKIKARNKVQFIKDDISEDLAVKALKERVEALKARADKDTK
ncbi:hypothetical protein EHE19_002910 [Ruminiclostridium herbifermentans]|uniref:Uncharacterized protein n=1 Tax=Ruminiclostridium herbifermentans TaxID=2488810 RepID=A0A4V6EPM9_9FIRM|nr:hypothetical protein [Ruminiclostridium herbifermentans]QNU67491.1 hypothetical protein EHE19_002910 [Ruminiclostridium herbifermentans]